jgi:periplasmic protein TonB
MRVAARTAIFGVSLGAHLALGAGLAAIPARSSHSVVAISFVETKKPKKPADPPSPPPPPPPPEPPAPHPARAKAAPAPPKDAPSPPAGAAPAAADSFPDFGLSLSGQGSGGLAVPPRAFSGPAPTTSATAKALTRAPARADDCSDPPAKPRPVSNPMPAYPADALAARVSGFVRVAIDVAPDGHVAGAQVLQGLGHGCDEASLAAARTARFEPVVRCGKPAQATVRVRYTFSPPSP